MCFIQSMYEESKNLGWEYVYACAIVSWHLTKWEEILSEAGDCYKMQFNEGKMFGTDTCVTYHCMLWHDYLFQRVDLCHVL